MGNGAVLTQRSSIWNRNFICALIGHTMLSLSHNSVNTLVSTYAVHLGAGPVLMGTLTGIFFGVALAMRPVAGPINTKIDKRILMIIVFCLGFVVNLGYALFHSIGMFLFFRVLNGVQYGIIGSLLMTIASDALPADRMASGMGVFGAGGAIASAIGPSLSVALRDYGTAVRDADLGFTFVFLLASAAMLIAVLPAFLLHPDKKTKSQLESTGAWYKNIATVKALGPTVVILLTVFGYALYSAYAIPFAEEQGIVGVGSFFTVIALALLVSRPICGRLTDKHGYIKIMVPGAILFIASFVLVGTSKSLFQMLAGAVIGGVGYGAVFPGCQAMAIEAVRPEKRAVASNTLYVGIDCGYFVSPIIGGIIYKSFPYSTVILAGLVPSVLGLVAFLAFWPSFKRMRAQARAEQQS